MYCADAHLASRQVFEQQKLKKWPGLCKETAKICLELGIEDVNLTNLSKDKYMKLFLEACHKKNEEKLRTLATGKCSRISKEVYQKKDYILFKDIFSARQHYRTRWNMQAFAGNYSHDKRFARSNWMCLCEKSREEEGHILSGECQVYGDLVDKYSDLTNDDNLVALFREVLSRREQLSKQTNNN